MGEWLRSGLRRDVCLVVYALGDPTGQAAKAALERHYDRRVTPETFYGALDALENAGHVVEREDGLQDRYELTPGGKRALEAHHAWASERIAAGRDGGDGEDGDGGDAEDGGGEEGDGEAG